MSLLNEMMEDLAFMNKTKVSDGEGGFTTSWEEGATFKGMIVIDNSSLAQIADAIKEIRSYTITVSKSVPLEKGDVIKRLSDGSTYKIQSETGDIQTPQSSALDVAQAKAERWELT